MKTQNHQRLAGLVVQLAAYTPALLLLRLQQLPGKLGDRRRITCRGFW
jgi:hypothetical protein